MGQRVDFWLSSKASVVGDVGSYYLPYVNRLRELGECRFICLKRDRVQTIASFMKHSAGANHWTEHDGKKWRRDPQWDVAFPKYKVASKRGAIGRYWDEYYATANELSRDDDFAVYPVDGLNDEDVCTDMLRFAVIPKEAIVGLRLNRA